MKKTDLTPDDPIRPHVYDGIQEYDNRLPNWWLWTLYAAMIFSFLYWFSWYQSRIADTDEERLLTRLERIETARLQNSMANLGDDSFWAMAENAAFIDAGRDIYMANCVACHGPNLEGGIGENLVDNEWMYIDTASDIYAIINDGSPDKDAGMQAWGTQLGSQRIAEVTAFILSYHQRADLDATVPTRPDML